MRMNINLVKPNCAKLIMDVPDGEPLRCLADNGVIVETDREETWFFPYNNIESIVWRAKDESE